MIHQGKYNLKSSAGHAHTGSPKCQQEATFTFAKVNNPQSCELITLWLCVEIREWNFLQTVLCTCCLEAEFFDSLSIKSHEEVSVFQVSNFSSNKIKLIILKTSTQDKEK